MALSLFDPSELVNALPARHFTLRILVISYFYPPDRAVGGQRARKVVEALEGAGHEVSVIAAGEDQTMDGPTLRVRPLPSLRDLHRKLRLNVAGAPASRGREPKPNREESGRAAPSDVPRWKRWVFSLIWLPDDRQGFILPAVLRALRSPRPHIIYTTAPPFSVHLVGLLFKALTGVRWIAEFRDPWTFTPWKPWFVRSAFTDQVERTLERHCVDRADMVVAVSDGIAADIGSASVDVRLVTVRNGIERLERAVRRHAVPDPGPFRIVYVGSFYHTRDPFPFLEAIGDLVRHRNVTDQNLRVEFIGTAASYGGRSISAMAIQTGIENLVHLEGWMPPEDCLNAVTTADALLLLALGQPHQVPNKLYEYLGSRRPILAIADEDGETARMLREVGGHLVVGMNEREDIRDAVEELLSRPRREAAGDLARLKSWTTPNQMNRLIQAVGGMDVG